MNNKYLCLKKSATVTLIKKVDRTVDIIQRAQKLHLFLSTFFYKHQVINNKK